MRSINIRRTRQIKICQIRGCGNRNTVLASRSADMRGGIRICPDCARAIMAFYDAEEAEKKAAKKAEAKAEAKKKSEISLDDITDAEDDT